QVVATPGEKRLAAATACGVFPFSLGRETEVGFGRLLLGFQEGVQVVGAPVTKGGSLFPVDADHGIIRISRVGIVALSHRLVIRIGEVPYPNQRVRIDLDRFLDDEFGAGFVGLAIGGGLEVEGLVLVNQLVGVNFAAAEDAVVGGEHHGIQLFSGALV